MIAKSEAKQVDRVDKICIHYQYFYQIRIEQSLTKYLLLRYKKNIVSAKDPKSMFNVTACRSVCLCLMSEYKEHRFILSNCANRNVVGCLSFRDSHLIMVAIRLFLFVCTCWICQISDSINGYYEIHGVTSHIRAQLESISSHLWFEKSKSHDWDKRHMALKWFHSIRKPCDFHRLRQYEPQISSSFTRMAYGSSLTFQSRCTSIWM